MSLLIKALKKAERRHQEVTAQALEQVSSDATLQASEQDAHGVAAATLAAKLEAQAAPKQSLSLQLEADEPRPAAASASDSAVISPIEIELMHMERAKALAEPAPQAQPSAAREEPMAFAQVTVPALETASVSPQAREPSSPARPQNTSPPAQPIMPPGSPQNSPQSSPQGAAFTPAAAGASVHAAAAATPVFSGNTPEVARSAYKTMADPRSMLKKKVRDPGQKRSGWIRVLGLTIAGTLGAGGFLAWQATRVPSFTSQEQQAASVKIAPPAPTAEQLKEAYGDRDGKVMARPGDSPRDPTRRGIDKPRLAERTGTRTGAASGTSLSSTPASSSPASNSSASNSSASNSSASNFPASTSSSPASASAASTRSNRPESRVGPQIALVNPAVSGRREQGTTSASASASASVTAAAPQAASAPAGGPRLIRQDNTDRVGKLLEQAYNASGKQDRRAARQFYDQVLELDRNNIDALLGIASLQARDGDVAGAERLYLRVIDLDPQDAAARAGLASLRVSADPAGQESQLRHLLASDPAQPSLQFALGNSLAAQGRWNDAQQAYFQAFSGDNRQPDYAFNLAISLERVHQAPLALMYYKNALDLARTRPARFSAQQARTRIEALERSVSARAPVTTEASPASTADTIKD